MRTAKTYRALEDDAYDSGGNGQYSDQQQQNAVLRQKHGNTTPVS